MNSQIFIFLTSFVCWIILYPVAIATPQPAKTNNLSACSMHEQLVVLSGSTLTPLIGASVRKISLYADQGGGLSPITYQIDRRDKKDRYILGDEQDNETSSSDFILDNNDEIVFIKKEAGKRLVKSSATAFQNELVEIEIKDTALEPSAWVYARISNEPNQLHKVKYITYDPSTDTVFNNLYKIGFSKRLPFFIETLSWNLGHAESWSANVIDTMKIRHKGDLFGFIPFERTGADYDSKLTKFKAGPLRVIRRTENRVRVLWTLKTPVVYVDYVMTPNGFFMDTIIDIPFKIGLFFSNVETFNTIDWNNDPNLPQLKILPPNSQTTLIIDGKMSPEESDFNQLNADNLSIKSSLGTMHVRIDIPDDFPIKPWLYLRDNIDEPDAPENIPGQFGNLGFKTTGWENIDTNTHHMKFNICMKKGNELNAYAGQ